MDPSLPRKVPTNVPPRRFVLGSDSGQEKSPSSASRPGSSRQRGAEGVPQQQSGGSRLVGLGGPVSPHPELNRRLQLLQSEFCCCFLAEKVVFLPWSRAQPPGHSWCRGGRDQWPWVTHPATAVRQRNPRLWLWTPVLGGGLIFISETNRRCRSARARRCSPSAAAAAQTPQQSHTRVTRGRADAQNPLFFPR